MLTRLRRALRGDRDAASRNEDAPDDLALAAAALLIEAGRLDGRLDAAEEGRIEMLVRECFGLDGEATGRLLEAAKARTQESGHIYPFTRTMVQRFDHAERVRMIEMLWEVVYADGALHDFEANLLRRVAGLLYVTDQESGAARKRVLARIAKDGGQRRRNSASAADRRPTSPEEKAE